jgi:hypothetical protein
VHPVHNVHNTFHDSLVFGLFCQDDWKNHLWKKSDMICACLEHLMLRLESSLESSHWRFCKAFVRLRRRDDTGAASARAIGEVYFLARGERQGRVLRDVGVTRINEIT